MGMDRRGRVTVHIPDTAAFGQNLLRCPYCPPGAHMRLKAVVIRYVSLAPEIYAYRYRAEPPRFACGAAQRPLLQRDVRMGNPARAL